MSTALADMDEDADAPVERWAWVFWLLLVAALVPWLFSLVAVAKVFSDDELQVAFSALRGPSTGFVDRWWLVLELTETGWSSLVGSLGLLVLSGAAAGGRPHWLVVTRGPAVLGTLSLVCALVSAAYVGVTVWVLQQGPTERQLAMAENGYSPTPWWQWATDGALGLGALVVALTAVAVCVGTRDLGRLGEPDAAEEAPREPADPSPGQVAPAPPWVHERRRRRARPDRR